MARKPQKPQKGQPAIKELYNTVCDIIDYLPSLEVTGDQKSTYVTKSSAGTVIHAAQPNIAVAKKGQEYTSGKFIRITSGNAINCILTGGTDIEITPAGVINYTGSGGGGSASAYYDGRFIKISGSNTINSTLSGCGIVAANLRLIYDSGMVEAPPNYYITINETADANGYNIISCDLTHLTQLYNYSLTPNAQASIGSVNMDHYMKAGDFFLNNSTGNRGLGTQIGLYRHSIGNTVIDPETGEQHLVNPIMGLKVDLTVSGGTWISTSGVPRKIAGFDVDPEDLQINCLLTGTYDHYPHTSGFIDIVPMVMDDGQTWGVISTNLHGDETTIHIDPKYGTISCMLNPGGGNVPTPVANTVLSATSNGTMQWTTNVAGGTGGGMPWPNYANLDNEAGTMIMLNTRYQAGSAGGWLRISYKGNPVDDCYYVKIGPDGTNDPQIGLWKVGTYAYGNGEIGNTWLLPVPPENYIYVSFPASVASAWFDSAVSDDSPSLIPASAINYGGDIVTNYGSVHDLRSEAENYYNYIVNEAEDYYDANEYAEYAETDATQAENYADDSETKNAVLTGLGINSYTTVTQDTRALAVEVRAYATSARTAANAFPH